MKKEYWAYLEAMLKKHGFLSVPSQQQGTSVRWFDCAATGADVTAYLQFISKPTFRILEVHLGWHHDATYDFFLAALKADWPRGFTWLSEVGVLDAPCVCLFNLGGYMRWPGHAISFREPQSFYETVTHFGDVISKSDWGNVNEKGLLARYVENEKPFGWLSSCSCAIRLAHIAGLCASNVGDEEVFDRCAKTYSALIEAHMFSLGTASSWIAALRTRLLDAINKQQA
jgi:hypothetical protein